MRRLFSGGRSPDFGLMFKKSDYSVGGALQIAAGRSKVVNIQRKMNSQGYGVRN
jgi:hypothetical protein